MDVLGLAASIITLTSAVTLTGSTLTRLWGLRGSPLYVVSALNEVNDFTATLALVQSTLSEAEVPKDVLAKLDGLLSRARYRLEAFDRYLKENVLRDVNRVHGINQPKLRRRAKLKEIVGEAQQQIDGLQRGLLSAKVNLTLALGVAQVRTMPKLFTSIQNVSVVIAGGTSLPSMAMIGQAGIANNVEQAATLFNPYQHCNTSDPFDPDAPNVQSYVKIETKPLSRVCPRRCPCQCHVPSKAATPRWLRGLIGVAFIGFTGIPLLNYRSCNFKNCGHDRNGSGSVRFSYYFPTWLLRMGIEFTASWRDVSGIGGSWNLKMPQIINDAVIYNRISFAIEYDSVVEVQRLMAKYRVRAFDSFSSFSMQNPLDMAMNEGREDICYMLLENGADVHYRDGADGLTSAQYFWQLSLQNNTFSSLRSYPELEAVRNDLGWTVAHDSIISGDIVLLSHQLQLNPRLGQLTDCGGATALHWAASFANMEAISTLLNAGADVNAICKYGDSVLFWALYSGSVSCCEAIIDAGADVQLTNIEGDNVLMRCVSMSEPIEEILSLFLYLGVNLEAHDVDGATALMLASTYATSRVCTMLLDKGANVDTRDVFGHSAVWAATFSNRHSNLQLLVHRGASLNCLDEDGDSIIVGAALYADINTMEILKEARIEGLPMDPGSVGDYWDWFDARDKFFLGHRAPLEEEEEAFQALLDSIIPCPDPPPPTVVKSLDIPGAYPIDSTDDLGLATNSRIEEPADESDTGN